MTPAAFGHGTDHVVEHGYYYVQLVQLTECPPRLSIGKPEELIGQAEAGGLTDIVSSSCPVKTIPITVLMSVGTVLE